MNLENEGNKSPIDGTRDSGPMMLSTSTCEAEDKMFFCIPIKTGMLLSGLVILFYFIINPITDFYQYSDKYLSKVEDGKTRIQGVINIIATGILTIPGLTACFFVFRWI